MSNEIQNLEAVAVFCGSRPGKQPIYVEHATELGRLLALLNVKMVYGGGNVGIMGATAESVLKHNGQVMGVMPKILVEHERQHAGLTELIVVDDMHTRKKLMYEMSDAVIILPGGFGTMDELFEVTTWNQLKIHDKKIFILNTNGFYDYLIAQIHKMEQEGFLFTPITQQMIICSTPQEIFNKLSL